MQQNIKKVAELFSEMKFYLFLIPNFIIFLTYISLKWTKVIMLISSHLIFLNNSKVITFVFFIGKFWNTYFISFLDSYKAWFTDTSIVIFRKTFIVKCKCKHFVKSVDIWTVEVNWHRSWLERGSLIDQKIIFKKNCNRKFSSKLEFLCIVCGLNWRQSKNGSIDQQVDILQEISSTIASNVKKHWN